MNAVDGFEWTPVVWQQAFRPSQRTDAFPRNGACLTVFRKDLTQLLHYAALMEMLKLRKVLLQNSADVNDGTGRNGRHFMSQLSMEMLSMAKCCFRVSDVNVNG